MGTVIKRGVTYAGRKGPAFLLSVIIVRVYFYS